MKTRILAMLVASAALSSLAYAQNRSEGITESTDPARAAAVEARARELQSMQSNQSGASGSSDQMSSGEHRKKMGRSHHKRDRHMSGGSASHQAGHGTSGQSPSANESTGSK